MTDNAVRTTSLGQMLRARRSEMEHAIQGRIRDGRAGRPSDGHDTLESSEAANQGAMTFALLQMEADTLVLIDGALTRLGVGHYGSCVECERDISEKRLQALPFALRCRACEARNEEEGEVAQAPAHRLIHVDPVSASVRF